MTPTTQGASATAAIEKIRGQHPAAIMNVATHRGETTLTIRPEDLLPVARLLRDDPDLAYRHLSNITAVDWSKYPGHTQAGSACPPARFATIYQLFSLKAATSGSAAASRPGSAASGPGAAARITLKVPAAASGPGAAASGPGAATFNLQPSTKKEGRP